VLSAAALLHAQGDRSTIDGTVTDQTGAAVPGATVKATEINTNVETTATTNDAGVYRMPYMPLGTYRVVTSKPGFKTAVAENVVLRVAQTLTVDLKLELGNVSERVQVSAEAPPIETGTAEIGRYVSEKEFDTWPIVVSDGQRQIQDFIFRALPGTTGGTFQGSINGGQYYSHEILIEGIPLGRMDLQGGSNNEFSPTADSISEFKLQTGTIDARYGGGSTAVANFAIKSGTNRVHGTGFGYFQNDVLRANSFNNNAVGRIRPPFKLFDWGYEFDGPVVIPKIYNGRNKTFWMTSFDKDRVRDFTSTGFSTLPTVDFKQGNFSRLLNPAFTGNPRSGTVVGTDVLGRPVVFGQIYNPLTTRLVSGTVVRDPFPSNIIPQAQMSQIARNILQQAPITDPLVDRLLLNTPNLSSCCPNFDEHVFSLKMDHHLSERHVLNGYYSQTFRQRNNSPGGRWGNPPGSPTDVYQLQSTPGHLVRLGWDWTISPSVLNHAAIGYNRFVNLNQSVYIDQGWASKVGFKNLPDTHFPALVFGGASILGGGIGAGGRLGSTNAGGQVNGSTISQDDLTIIHGKHNFKMGFEFRRYYYNEFGRGNDSGTFNFSSLQTQLPGFVNETGHAFASFLLGQVASTNRSVIASFFGYRTSTPALYFADDWKATRRLTLNIGLRWEIFGPLSEVASRMSGLDPKAPNPGAGGRPGALVFVGDQGRNTFQNWYFKMLNPRFGFAYQLVENKIVVRGGYGIINTPNISNGFGFPGKNGFNGSISVNTANTPLQFPQDAVFSLDSPYPVFTATLPNKSPTLLNGQGINYIAPDSIRPPYTQNWNFGLQFALPYRFALDTSYIGNKGTRLEWQGADRYQQLPVPLWSQYGDVLLQNVTDSGPVPRPYPGFTGTVGQALRQFPQYTGVSEMWANFGNSSYHSLQVTLTRHFSNGLAILGAYTWSKAISTADSAIDASGVQDVYNLRLERSVSNYNIPNYFKGTWIYELPWGPGKPINLRGWTGKILGGWSLSGIQQYRSGDALAISTSNVQNSRVFSGTIRPDLIPGVPVVLNGGAAVLNGVGTIVAGQQYLNPAAFRQVPTTSQGIPLRPGTAPRYLPNVRGPARVSEDFSFSKKFLFTESANLEIRADFINAFNRAGRGNPVTDITSPNFGMITGSAYGPRNIQLGARVTF
jgi:hypothetical protein